MSEREAELLKRLRRLEGVVEELSGQVEIDAIKHSPSSDQSSTHKDGESADSGSKPNSVRVVGMDEGTSKKAWLQRGFSMGLGPPKSAFSLTANDVGTGRLVVDEGKSQYLSSPFWASISDEVEEIRDLLEEQDLESDEDIPILPSKQITDSNHQSFIMGYNSSEVNLKSLHPLPSQIPFYWQTFLENVQPLVMIIHAQTMSKVIKEVQNNLDSLSESTEALMFAIYFATVTSMNADEVRTNFGVEKPYLVKQYRFGVEQALARAGFLNTNEIVTVQAFVLFLVCVRRHDDTRFVWSLTGLAIRIAQSLGLHRDGSKFGLSPFDTEMRRRLWWQVCILDTRASEDHGSDPSLMEQAFDTEFPLSINDSDLDPEATEFPPPRPGVSEMTFCLIRYEICHLSRRLSYVPPGSGPCKLAATQMTLEDKESLIRECSDRLEEKYLKYCEDAGPLYWVAATVARLITAKMSLIIYHPLTQPGKPNSLSQDIKDRLFMASIEIIEYSQILESEASTKHWGWLFHTYVQWHAIAYILGELAIRPQSLIVDRAWRAMDGVFNDWDGAVSKTKTGMLWQPMRKLMAKARRKRQENMANRQVNQGLGMNSEFIRPPPSGPSSDRKTDIPPYLTSGITQARLAESQSPPGITANQNLVANGYSQPPSDCPVANGMSTNSDTQMQPQIVGMGPSFAPEQIQLQLQQQQQQQQQMQQTPWLMDDNALLDLNMQDLEGDVNWEGWDDLVRDFQMENDQQMQDFRGPTLGGMGSWW